jgi:restriction system protein
MGHIIWTSAAMMAALSEDAGFRSGIALSRDDLLNHLGENHSVREHLEGEERFIRIGSTDHEDAVGDLLFALGTTDAPGMPTISMRLTRAIGPEWQSLLTIEQLMTSEAIANHYVYEWASRGVQIEEARLREELRSELIPGPDVLLPRLLVTGPH